MIEDYANYDGLGLAELVRAGEVTPLELVESAIEASARINPALNAICHDLSERARTAAKRAPTSGPFAGVPFLLKDIGAQMQDTPHECGSRYLEGVVSTHDSTLTTRFHATGLITFGKTATPEFGAQLTTEPVLTGITRNPWNLDVTPGGSSGGSAAAVAAGIVPIAHANDGLGSIRIPAANCGVFGIKPTRQRTPTGPYAGEVSSGRAVEFVVSRSVRDSAALLDAVHGADAGPPYCAPPPERPYLQELATHGTPLRIAVMTTTFSGAAVHEDCAAAVRNMANACADLGHQVDEATPTIAWDAYRSAIRTAAMATFAHGVAGAGRAFGRTPSQDNLEPLTWLSFLEGQQLSAQDYLAALDTFATLQRDLGRFFERFDVLLSPVLSQPPADIGWLGVPDDDMDAFWERFAGDTYSPFAGIFNVTGQPAASIPSGESADRRPIGTQLAARLGAEGVIFRLAGQLEQVRPWRDRKPIIHVDNPAAAGTHRQAAVRSAR